MRFISWNNILVSLLLSLPPASTEQEHIDLGRREELLTKWEQEVWAATLRFWFA